MILGGNFKDPEIQEKKFQCDSQQIGEIIGGKKGYHSDIFKDGYQLNPTDVSDFQNGSSPDRDKNEVLNYFFGSKRKSKNPMIFLENKPKHFSILGENQYSSSKQHKLEGIFLFNQDKSNLKLDDSELNRINKNTKGQSNETNKKRHFRN